MISNSNPANKWSLAEAEDTIKAIFLLNENEDGQPLKLRYTDIKKLIERQGRTISPRMLAEALNSLCQKKEMTVERSEDDLREKFYSIVPINREQVIQLISSIDTATIQQGRVIGVVGDPDEGWSFYSVPEKIKRRIRPRLRTEAKAFKKKIEEILDDEESLFLKDLERKVKGCMEKKSLEDGLEACDLILASSKETSKIQFLMLLTSKLVEEFVPSSSWMFERIGKNLKDPWGTLMKSMYGLTDEEYKESLKVNEDLYIKLNTIFAKLSPKDRERFAERLISLMTLRSSLCAVIRL